MDIAHFVNAKAMRKSIRKLLVNMTFIDRYMMNNIRIRIYEGKLELDNANIVIGSSHFDNSFITNYKDTADNYNKRKYYLPSY